MAWAQKRRSTRDARLRPFASGGRLGSSQESRLLMPQPRSLALFLQACQAQTTGHHLNGIPALKACGNLGSLRLIDLRGRFADRLHESDPLCSFAVFFDNLWRKNRNGIV